jgi:hypothetical protein
LGTEPKIADSDARLQLALDVSPTHTRHACDQSAARKNQRYEADIQ